MKRNIFVFAGLLLSQSLLCQATNFHEEFNSINERLMLSLGSYAVANFAISGVGYMTSEDEYSKRFHEMNVMWNTVNFGLALPGYIKARSVGPTMSRDEMVKTQKKTESIFLINSILDVGYIAVGVWMHGAASNQLDQENLYEGYGNSLILQGSFLLAFDALAYYIHNCHGKELPAYEKITLSASSHSVGLRLTLD